MKAICMSRASGWRHAFAAVLCSVAITAALRGSEQQDGWLNVRDVGASGSKYQATAKTGEGSKQITVANVGDFKVGQGVMVSKSHIRHTQTRLWGTGERYKNMKPLNGSVEVRGSDGSAGSWLVYAVDIAPSPATAPKFRWSDDLGRTWQAEQAITNDWQKLNGGIEVKSNKRDWEAGSVISFGARDRLVTRIEKIDGTVLTLADAANRSVTDAVVRHNDTQALQAAVDRAVKDKMKLHVPAGRYRIAHGIRIEKPGSITIEGASAEDTIFDIGEGEGRYITINGGTEAIIGDNQIYVRGASDGTVTGIWLPEPVLNVNVHDNLIRNCGRGITGDAAQYAVTGIVDNSAFVAGISTEPANRWESPQYRGGMIAWFQGGKPVGSSEMIFFDPETSRSKLKQPREMRLTDRFEIVPRSANWSLHDNVVTDCPSPIALNSNGSFASIVKDNVISRNETSEAKEAIHIERGKSELLGNRVSDFSKTPPTH